ncbi:GNAT family N-acetyltransferase [Sinorhizobium meliloti]|nr:GNAT family N-acetyltransferase [Sinorhizobium meliloti]
MAFPAACPAVVGRSRCGTRADTGRLREGEVDGFVFRVKGEPAGYIQSWIPSEYDEEPWAQGPVGRHARRRHLHRPPEMTGKGVAAMALRAFAARLFETAPRASSSTPTPGNAAAVRAYAKAVSYLLANG